MKETGVDACCQTHTRARARARTQTETECLCVGHPTAYPRFFYDYKTIGGEAIKINDAFVPSPANSFEVASGLWF